MFSFHFKETEVENADNNYRWFMQEKLIHKGPTGQIQYICGFYE